MSDKQHDYFFWTDLETTGSDLDSSMILEIGYAITNKKLDILYEDNIVMPFPPRTREYVKEIVRDMHDANGLWIDAARAYNRQPYHAKALYEADVRIASLIREYNGSKHMAFAGSGIAHFDRQFFKRDLPLTNAGLTYWPMDIGSARRIYQMFGGHTDWLPENKSHRALDDVKFHIEETKYFLSRLKES